MPQPQTTTSPNPSADTLTKICGTHGAYQAMVIDSGEILGRPIFSRCPECSREAHATAEARQKAEAEAMRVRRVARLNEAAGIPLRFQDRTLDNYRAELPGQKRALTVARRFVESWPEQREKGTSLIFTGGPGTGKTHLACAIGSEVMRAHLGSVGFGTVTELLRSIKDTYRKDSETSEQQAINRIVGFDLVIVDEIGVQLGTDHEKLLLFEVLNGRYQQCRPTVLLSNLSAADLEGYLGQRVMDRYRECGAVIAFDWQSFRGAR